MRVRFAIGKFLFGITLPMLLMTTVTHASGGIRCGSKLIMEGDTREKTRRLCGEPEDIVYTTTMRLPSYLESGRVIYFGDELVETRVETWTYNFGPNKLMRRLLFVNDILENIETLGYGHHPK